VHRSLEDEAPMLGGAAPVVLNKIADEGGLR